LRKHFPNWKMRYDLPRILDEIASRHVSASARGANE
jgi:hypothetical protein